jgi:hypothetical protein
MNNARAGAKSGSKETQDFSDALYALIRSSRRALALHWKGTEAIEGAQN